MDCTGNIMECTCKNRECTVRGRTCTGCVQIGTASYLYAQWARWIGTVFFWKCSFPVQTYGTWQWAYSSWIEVYKCAVIGDGNICSNASLKKCKSIGQLLVDVGKLCKSFRRVPQQTSKSLSFVVTNVKMVQLWVLCHFHWSVFGNSQWQSVSACSHVAIIASVINTYSSDALCATFYM